MRTLTPSKRLILIIFYTFGLTLTIYLSRFRIFLTGSLVNPLITSHWQYPNFVRSKSESGFRPDKFRVCPYLDFVPNICMQGKTVNATFE